MAKKKKDLEKEIEETTEQLKAKGEKKYAKLIDRLEKDRAELRKEVNRNYKEGRRYVRSNPEEGVLMGLVGGITLGFLLGRLIK